ncbi:uncharacterized protein ARMOST_11399 [Armillaria ostoyae]|uniref:Uncharacterized protein n=1 Tax=Armillaria ostoyae TaxID=47428 RepID=A0A284RH12_ARMOS|nr:uncharacterized protein ARMOST_11399 [Armillaria ostoyae]
MLGSLMVVAVSTGECENGLEVDAPFALMGINGWLDSLSNAPTTIASRAPRCLPLPTPSSPDIGIPHATQPSCLP